MVFVDWVGRLKVGAQNVALKDFVERAWSVVRFQVISPGSFCPDLQTISLSRPFSRDNAPRPFKQFDFPDIFIGFPASQFCNVFSMFRASIPGALVPRFCNKFVSQFFLPAHVLFAIASCISNFEIALDEQMFKIEAKNKIHEANKNKNINRKIPNAKSRGGRRPCGPSNQTTPGYSSWDGVDLFICVQK